MPYEVSYDEQDKIILMRASGMVTHEEHCEARRRAAQLCRENNCLRVLVNLQDLNTRKSSTQNCFEFGQSIAEEDIEPSTRMAVVIPQDLDSVKDVQFTAAVAANRGRFLWLFKTIDEARQWLSQF